MEFFIFQNIENTRKDENKKFSVFQRPLNFSFSMQKGKKDKTEKIVTIELGKRLLCDLCLSALSRAFWEVVLLLTIQWNENYTLFF